MAEDLTINKGSSVSKLGLDSVLPALDDAVKQSNNVEELIQVALVGVVSVLVAGVVKNVFRK